MRSRSAWTTSFPCSSLRKPTGTVPLYAAFTSIETDSVLSRRSLITLEEGTFPRRARSVVVYRIRNISPEDQDAHTRRMHVESSTISHQPVASHAHTVDVSKGTKQAKVLSTLGVSSVLPLPSCISACPRSGIVAVAVGQQIILWELCSEATSSPSGVDATADSLPSVHSKVAVLDTPFLITRMVLYTDFLAYSTSCEVRLVHLSWYRKPDATTECSTAEAKTLMPSIPSSRATVLFDQAGQPPPTCYSSSVLRLPSVEQFVSKTAAAAARIDPGDKDPDACGLNDSQARLVRVGLRAS